MNTSNSGSSPATAGTMPEASKSCTFLQYLHQLSGQEKDPDTVIIDHSYSKAWNMHPDANHSKPARMLFMKNLSRHVPSVPTCDVDIDMEEPTIVTPAYDNMKTRLLMSECDRFLRNNLNHDLDEGEDRLNKAGWTPTQNRLYKQTMKVIQNLRLARLSFEGTATEPVRRQEAINSASRRLRQVFSGNCWDMMLICWLHQILMDQLNENLLSDYLEILRTLKCKVPNLIDKLLVQANQFHMGIFGSSSETFNQLLKKPWDPVFSLLNQQKPKKLPGNALILVVPNTPNQPPISTSPRSRFWNSQLGCLGKVVHVSAHSVSGVHRIPIDQCLDQIFSVTRNKVIELKNQSPNRPIVLFGWMIGALIACHVALEEAVSAVVCLGFPLTGVGGSRGDLDDPLLDSKVPTLFVIGQNASTCSMDDIEDFRERMKAETGLVVIGGSDDMLKVSSVKKKVEGVTQSMVDRCLVDEVSDFLNGVLSPQFSSPSISKRSSVGTSLQIHPQETSPTDDAKRKRRKPREYSPEISPVRRKPRQMNRQNAQKMSTSSTSSESSSTGSWASEKNSATTEVKKKPHRKVGRPASNLLHKRPMSKVVQQNKTPPPAATKAVEPSKTPQTSPTKLQPSTEKQEVEAQTGVSAAQGSGLPTQGSGLPTQGSGLPTQGSGLPTQVSGSSAQLDVPPSSSTLCDTKCSSSTVLALNEQKNVPVDVEKAFGKDSSFLPRPLTPPDVDGETFSSVLTASTTIPKIDDTEPATTKPLSVIDAASVLTSPQKPKIVSVSPSSLASLLGVPGHKISYLKPATSESPLTTFSTQVNSTIAIQKPQVVSKITEPPFEHTKGQVKLIEKLQYHNFPLTSSSLVSAKNNPLSPAKILASSGLSIKNLLGQPLSTAGKSLLTASKPQNVIMASSISQASDSTTYLISTPDANCPGSSKTIQFHRMVIKNTAPSQVPILPKPSMTSASGDLEDGSNKPAEPQSCNLSLLSDVAGMKEPMPQDAQVSTGATLVKLASLKERRVGANLNFMKRIRVMESAPSPPQIMETPEEQAEKQMAIRALNSSFDDPRDSYGNKEPAYSVYPRSGTSHVSHPRSGHGYSVMMPRGVGMEYRARNATPHRRGRGRPAGGVLSGGRRFRMQRIFP